MLGGNVECGAVNNSLIERPHWSICHLSFRFFVCSPRLITFNTVLPPPFLSLCSWSFALLLAAMPATACCHAVLKGPSLQLSSLSALSAFFPSYLSLSINNLLCHSFSAGQFSLVSFGSDLLCHCYSLVGISWSLSAELCITLSSSTFCHFITLPLFLDLVL